MGMPVVCLFLALLGALPSAAGQQVQMDPFPSPDAIDPGSVTSTNIEVSGFTATVTLTCQVTPQPATGNAPECQVSPSSLSSPGGPSSATVSGNGASAGLYTVSVTASAPGNATQTAQQNLTILSVAPSFTITVTTPVTPTSVHAGNGGSGVITVTPSNGYNSPGSPTAGITLSCSSMTPLVTIPPACSFTYASGTQGVVITGGVPNTATITINTSGPINIGAVGPKSRHFYALWLPLPMLALAGLGAAAGGKRSRKAWALLALFVVSASFLLVPACGTNTNQTSTPNGTTPNNAYSFTITGVDIDGTTSSNTATVGTKNSSAPTVSLTVD